jgi:hypothetical protein
MEGINTGKLRKEKRIMLTRNGEQRIRMTEEERAFSNFTAENRENDAKDREEKNNVKTRGERASRIFLKLWEAADQAADSALAAQKKDGLICGIAYSIGLLNTNFHEGAAEFLLKESGIKSKKELKAAGCDQFDIDNIGKLLPEKG